MKYDLSSSIGNYGDYDEMVQRYAEQCIGARAPEDIIALDAEEYAQTTWDSDERAGTAPETDNPAEAKARFMSVFVETVKNCQSEVGHQLAGM
jgi:hypothetical protein